MGQQGGSVCPSSVWLSSLCRLQPYGARVSCYVATSQALQKVQTWSKLQHQCPQPLSWAYLPGVVQTLSLDVISLLVHHLHLGVQVPAQVLGDRNGRPVSLSASRPGPWALSTWRNPHSRQKLRSPSLHLRSLTADSAARRSPVSSFLSVLFSLKSCLVVKIS